MSWMIKHEPYEVQSRALLNTASAPHGYAYFMEMGLGKTAVIIAEFVKLKSEGKVDKLVVVAPHSLLGNWAREIKMWAEDSLSVTIWNDQEPADAHILNYEAFAVGGARGVKFVYNICQKEKVMLVLDESTQIKNNSSVRTKALLSLAREAEFTRILSGAPQVQGPQDLWSQLKFIGQLKGMNYYQYRNRYCVMGGFQGKQVLGPNSNNIHEIQKVLQEHSFRAKKSDWLDLPPKTYLTRDIKMSASYISAYKKMVEELLMEIGDQEITAPMAVTLMLKLQQISSGFIISDDGNTIPLKGANNKLNELISIIATELDTKVIVPVYFQESQRLLQEAFDKAGIKYARILSKMSPEEIEHEKKLFNEDDDVQVAIAQTSSQKYGHTLLGTDTTPCFTTIFYENTFSLDDRLQMEDRNHRIGQRNAVNIIDLNCSPVEAKAIRALKHKENLAEVVVDVIKSVKF